MNEVIIKLVKHEHETDAEFVKRVKSTMDGEMLQLSLDTLWDECFRPTVKYDKGLDYDDDDFMNIDRSVIVGEKDGNQVDLSDIEYEVIHAVYRKIKEHFEID